MSLKRSSMSFKYMRDAAVFVSLSNTQSFDEAYGLWQAAVHRKPVYGCACPDGL